MNAKHLKPCGEHGHQKGAPPCFHNPGGEYLFIHNLRSGMRLLQHLQTGKVGLAHVEEIIDNQPQTR